VATINTRRVNVNFPEPIYRTLEELAREKGLPMADVLREAIGLQKWFDDTRKEGARILVERDGAVREVIKV
jgi:hypothetical protein